MKRFLSFLTALALLIGVAGEGLAQQDKRAVRVQGRKAADPRQRVALVIGNAQYKNISALRNPQNDARDMAAALERSGFRVTLLLNGTRKRMNRAIRAFGDKLRKGGVGLFFYAGHGVQLDGVNYLIPIGADIRNEDEVEDEAVSANRVMRKMKSAGNDLNMVFLDACRNNPYKGAFRSASRGLAAVMNAPKGSLISFATGAGNVAADGSGRNGIYTKNLLRYMKVPGLELGQMMRRVRAGVQRDTNDEQTPYELSSLTGNFYFRGGPAPATVAAVKPSSGPAPAPYRTIDAEGEFWKTIKDSQDKADYEAYLKEYPKGRFAGLARVRIRQSGRRVQATQDREFWEAVKDSKDPAEFEAYLQEFPQGRYLRLARLKLSRLIKSSIKFPPPESGAVSSRRPSQPRPSKARPTAVAAVTAPKRVGGEKHTKQGQASIQRRIALFPVSISSGLPNSLAAADDFNDIFPKISKLFSSADWNLKMTHSFYPLGLQNIVSLENNRDIAKNSWSGFFSKKPNANVLSRYGMQIGVDFVILYEIHISINCPNERIGGDFTVHLFDVKAQRFHRRKGQWICGNGYKEIADGIKALLEEQASAPK